MIYTWKRNFVLLLSHFLVNISTTKTDKVVSILFSQCRWTYVGSTFIFNVETTLVHRRWIDVILSTLFQRCFANVENTSINVRQLNIHFQANINVDVFAGYTKILLFLKISVLKTFTNFSGKHKCCRPSGSNKSVFL